MVKFLSFRRGWGSVSYTHLDVYKRQVIIDAGDDGDHGRRDDIGGVQTAAQSHLQHGDIAVLLGEPAEPQHRDQLELGDGVARCLE